MGREHGRATLIELLRAGKSVKAPGFLDELPHPRRTHGRDGARIETALDERDGHQIPREPLALELRVDHPRVTARTLEPFLERPSPTRVL
ncbi:MAG: hypothetical protein QM784_11750 [Polyangiaceae bacterium]